MVATDANDGSARYFTKDDLSQDHYEPLMASSAVPVANQPYAIDGIPYFDGGMADPIPLRKAFETAPTG